MRGVARRQEIRQHRDQRVQGAGQPALALAARQAASRRAGLRRGRGVALARQRQEQRRGRQRQRAIGQHRAAPAQPFGEQVPDRPHHGGRQPAEQGDLRHGPAGGRPGGAGQRGEGRVVQAQPHARAQHGPGQVIVRQRMGRGQRHAAQRREHRA
ncbi:hypothetical protein WJ968_28820 [Achromobacter xylosoxidans]